MVGLTPCYECSDRKIGCHSNCKDYIDFNEKRQKYLAKQKIEYQKPTTMCFKETPTSPQLKKSNLRRE
jgi:hypothetical protein